MKRRRVLIIYDVHNDGPKGRLLWAYGRRAESLKRHAPPDLSITIACHEEAESLRLDRYALVLLIDYQAAISWRDRVRKAGAVFCVQFNKDARSRQKEWARTLDFSDWVIVNNEHRFHFDGVQPRTCCISNGVEREVFRSLVPTSCRDHRCLWTGGTGHAKRKNYLECIDRLRGPLETRGFSHSFRPVTNITPDQVLGTDEMVKWYNSGSYILNASETEGTPSTMLEGMACGCIPITTDVGNVPEIIRDRENGVIVPSTRPKAFLEAIEYAREHRERLSAGALDSIQSWSYGGENGRAQWFYQLFRRLINDGPDSIDPFSYSKTWWGDI